MVEKTLKSTSNSSFEDWIFLDVFSGLQFFCHIWFWCIEFGLNRYNYCTDTDAEELTEDASVLLSISRRRCRSKNHNPLSWTSKGSEKLKKEIHKYMRTSKCYLELLPFNWWTCASTFLKSTICWFLHKETSDLANVC